MLFMSFSQCYFCGFPLVWYHEQFINKAMKPPYTMNTRAKTMVKVWCRFLMFLFYDDENPIIKQHEFKENVVGFPCSITRNSESWKTCGFPLNLELLNGNVLSKFMDFSLHCNGPWKSMLIRRQSFHLERGEACTLDEDL